MKNSLNIVLVSTPIGFVGSGKGGGVELTITSLIKGLHTLGHEITLIAPEGSFLPKDCDEITIKNISGKPQLSWQHLNPNSPVQIPFEGVLPKMWEEALDIGINADAVLNFGYDWLPIWLTSHVKVNLFHLISMGCESEIMRKVIEETSNSYPSRFAFHTSRQASDFSLSNKPFIVGNGFDLANYEFSIKGDGPIGWAGRVAPEKGLEDAVAVANKLGEKLIVWGVIEDQEYANKVQKLYPKGAIEWRGFLPTYQFQKEIRNCRALINTPKWNEAYGNVVVEAMACGVPVVSYDRGGPGELIDPYFNGILVEPDNIDELIKAVKKINLVDRKNCREWVDRNASINVFAERIYSWITSNSKINTN